MGCYGGCNNNYNMYPQMTNLYPAQSNMCPNQGVQAADLESMYPDIYYKVNPMVKNYCDMMGYKNGMMMSPSKDQLDCMVDNIYNQVEPQVNLADEEDMEMEPNRPVGVVYGPGGYYGGRRLLRDVVGILLVQELLRRRPYGYNYGAYPGYAGYPGYPGYAGYPGYFGY